MTEINTRLCELGVNLPEATAPVANYLASHVSGNMLYISGQLPMQDGSVKYKGKVGRDLDVDAATNAARLCAINIIAHIKSECGADFNKFGRLIKLGVFVNSDPEFLEHAKVANGASDIVVEVFGNKGGHIRAAVGCSSLPFGAAVEIEAIVELKIND